MLAGGLLMTACGTADSSGDDDGAGSRDGAAAAASMELVADLAPGDAAAVGSSVNQFGFDLLGQLTDGTENTVTSPVCAAALLAMVLAGAGGQTADEMAAVLHLDDARDVRVGALLRELAAATGALTERTINDVALPRFELAAAVTGGAMLESAGDSFRVDRPFAFTISDSDTRTILFLGAVADPRG